MRVRWDNKKLKFVIIKTLFYKRDCHSEHSVKYNEHTQATNCRLDLKLDKPPELSRTGTWDVLETNIMNALMKLRRHFSPSRISLQVEVFSVFLLFPAFPASALNELHQRRLGPGGLTVTFGLEEKRLVESCLNCSDLKTRNPEVWLKLSASLKYQKSTLHLKIRTNSFKCRKLTSHKTLEFIYQQHIYRLISLYILS